MAVSKPTVTKSKLVTLCSTNNEGFGPSFPLFIYKGSSRSKKTDVQVSFPSYNGNLMFYEHFKEAYKEHPSRLSFMFVGGDEKGEINYNFHEYDHVTVVDFSHEFGTVNCMFQIISKLKKCSEVRFFLSNNNMVSSKNEASFVENLFESPPQYRSTTVTTLKIIQNGEIDPYGWSLDENRFAHILTYAICYFPNLSSLILEGLDGGGKTYDMVGKFCKEQLKLNPNFQIHSYSIKDGKTFCHPTPSSSSSSQQHCSKSKILNEAISISSLQGFSTSTSTMKDPRIRTLPIGIAPKIELINLSNARINPPMDESINQPTTAVNGELLRRETKPDVFEVPVPPKQQPEIINISDEEENGASLPKKAKKEKKKDDKDLLLPSSPSSTTSISTASMSSSPADHIPINGSSSLANIGSSYNDWENSSDEEPVAAPNAIVDALVADFADRHTTDSLLSILNNASLPTKITCKNFKQFYDRR